MESVTPLVAIRNYVNAGSSKPVSIQELKAFKDACKPEEIIEFGKQAAKELGVELVLHAAQG